MFANAARNNDDDCCAWGEDQIFVWSVKCKNLGVLYNWYLSIYTKIVYICISILSVNLAFRVQALFSLKLDGVMC